MELGGVEDVTPVRTPARGHQPRRALVDLAVPLRPLQGPDLGQGANRQGREGQLSQTSAREDPLQRPTGSCSPAQGGRGHPSTRSHEGLALDPAAKVSPHASG